MLSGTIGIALATFAAGWMPALPARQGIAVLALFALFCAGLKPVAATRFLAGACLGLLYGVLWGENLLDRRPAPALEGEVLEVRGLVLEPPQRRAFSGGGERQRFPFLATEFACPKNESACPADARRILLSYYGEQPIEAGERWRFQVRLKRPWGLANPGSFNYQAWLSQHRFAATGYVRDTGLRRLSAGRGWTGPHQRWRQRIANALRAGLPDSPARGVLLALSNGDRSAIGPEQWRRIRRYGLNHLIVISGLHVGMIAGLGFLIGRVFGRKPAHLSAALFALVYSAQAGFALPTLRALVMLATVQLVALGGRRVRPFRCMGVALFAVALIDPLATHNAGFWLSFAAVALIFYLNGQWPGVRGWRFVLLLQFSLSPATGLLASVWFGGASWLAPLANLLAVPVLTFWLAPLCMLASIVAPAFETAAGFLWKLASLPLVGFFRFDAFLSDLRIPLWLEFRLTPAAATGAIVGVVLLLAHRASPFRWVACVFFALLMFSEKPPPARDELRVTVLDVGQGLAVVLRTARATVIYDTGAGDPMGPNMAGSVILPFLQREGIDTVDLLVLSHGDRDHASGVYTLHDSIPIRRTWYGDARFEGLPDQEPCREGLALRLGDLELRALHPGRGPLPRKSNDRSCVLTVGHRGARLLLPGDIESPVELELVRRFGAELASDILLAPHHGSRTSSSGPFLRRVAPEIAVFSAGYRNRFGHPHPEVVARYRRYGIDVYDTAAGGAISLHLKNGNLAEPAQWREVRRFYWH